MIVVVVVVQVVEGVCVVGHLSTRPDGGGCGGGDVACGGCSVVIVAVVDTSLNMSRWWW